MEGTSGSRSSGTSISSWKFTLLQAEEVHLWWERTSLFGPYTLQKICCCWPSKISSSVLAKSSVSSQAEKFVRIRQVFPQIHWSLCDDFQALGRNFRKENELFMDCWTKEAFDRLKSALLEAPVLRLDDVSRPFRVHTDASNNTIATVLLQSNPDDPEEYHPVPYLSR